VVNDDVEAAELVCERFLTGYSRRHQDWILLDRFARSLAHSVGNAINVISGRLSLVGEEPALAHSSKNSLQRAQERLKRLHTDLRGALEFSAPPEHHVESVLSDTLASLREEGLVISENWAEIAECPVVADGTLAVSLVALLQVNTAYQQLAAAPQPWVASRTGQGRASAITVRITFHNQELPADRRALTEPWFSREAQTLSSAARYGRLLLAESLALLEEAQVAVKVESSAFPEELWGLHLEWPLKCAKP
jgi:hypothetical protein